MLVSTPNDFRGSYFPLVGALVGVLTSMLAHRFPRVWTTMVGAAVGWAGSVWFVTYDTTWIAVPMIISVLGCLLGSILALVLAKLVSGLVVGYCFSILVIVITGERLFTFETTLEAGVFIIVLSMVGMLYGLYKPVRSLIVGSSVSGGLLAATCIDIYGDEDFYTISTRYTIFTTPGIKLPAACGLTCEYMLGIWGLLAALGLVVQSLTLYLVPLEEEDKTYDSVNLNHGAVWTSVGGQEEKYLKRAEQSFGRLSALTSDDTAAAPGEAKFNYISPDLMPEEMAKLQTRLNVVFSNIQKRFGFQRGNVRNQAEHLLMLISNAGSRVGLDGAAATNGGNIRGLTAKEVENLAIQRVHNKLYSNYMKWCDHVGKKETYTGSNGQSEQKTLLENLALMLLVWGEAGTMRHTPEALCYFTHCTLKELRTKNPQYRDSGAFLREVIKPCYDVIYADKRDIYTKRRNYDDINEFFWSPKCFDYTYCNSGYNQDTQESDQDKPTIAEGLMTAEKTFLEFRSWFHVLNTFYPMMLFYLVGWHFMICLGVVLNTDFEKTSDRHHDNVTMCSFVITYAFLLLTREFLEIYVKQGVVNTKQKIGYAIRIVVKFAFLVLLSYYYYQVYQCSDLECDWTKFLITSAVFMFPTAMQILSIMFPILGRAGNMIFLSRTCRCLTEIWWPETTLYIGQNIGERDGDYFKYQLFWVLLLTWKMLISYNFQVHPCLNPTLWIWAQFKFFSAPMRVVMIVITWLPFFLVYLFDMYIWYAVWQGMAGLIVGMRNRVGQIHSFGIVPYIFEDMPAKLGEKLFQTKIPEGPIPSHVVVEGKGENAPLLDGENNIQMENTRASYGTNDESREIAMNARTNWRRFALIWNEMIEDLRRADMLSNEEQFIFSFRWVDLGFHKGSFQTPLFVATSTINASLDFIAEKGNAFQSADSQGSGVKGARERTTIQRSVVEYFSQVTRREGIGELWELTFGLVWNLIPDIDSKSGTSPREDIQQFAKFVTELATDQEDPYSMLMRTILLQQVASLKPKVLGLVRAARLARGAWKKHRKTSRKGPKHGYKISGTAIRKTFSFDTLKLQDRMSQKGHEIEKHVNLVRDQLIGLLKAVQGLVVKDGEVAGAGRLLNSKLESVTNFVATNFGKFEGHMSLLDEFFFNENSAVILNSLYTFLTVANEFVPRNSSARRRILFFCNSLFMDMPDAPPVAQMHSLTTLTPFYSEDVLYSKAYLQKRTKQGFSILLYLQTVYRPEWENFCERVGIKDQGDASILDRASPALQLEVRLWATRKGQTLFRTVDGMMLYEKAIRVLAELEHIPQIASDLRNFLDGKGLDNHSSAEAKGVAERPSPELLSCLKYQYVVSCQVYGRQKEEGDPKATDIEFLLRRFPNLRVAYIDNRKEEGKNGKYVSKYYSCLIKAASDHPRIKSPVDGKKDGKDSKRVSNIAKVNAEYDDEWEEEEDVSKVETVYRVELPGNPIIGEGKPENQNHAIIFTRGEFVQAIDMNQEGYFEEAVKMRNLLEEFDRDDSRKATTIVGFREHIFTGGLSSVANYMAMQEGCFVTLGQRVLHDPLMIRLHYGHPDVFDKMFYITRGGVSKASKGINLSEDIFAGFNTVSRGGHVAFKEYIQCGKGRDVGLQQLFKFEGKLSCGNAMQSLTRDMYRLCRSLDFLKLMSFFYGGIGFYISTLLAVWGLYAFCYQRVIIASFNLSLPKSFVGIDTVGYWIGTMGVLLTAPIICSIGLERGAWKALYKVSYMLISGGPLFFMFHMGTKAHFFARTILSGGARYRPTGRGFVADHTKFAELFRFYMQSHFSGAVEMVVLLVLYGIFDRRVHHYWAVTWCAWVIVLSWLFAPLWLNPMGFEWEAVVRDAKDFVAWMDRPEGAGSRSWKTWWEEENSFIDILPIGSKFILALLSFRHLVIAGCIFWYLGLTLFSPTVLACAGVMVLVGGYYSIANRRVPANQLRFFRGLKAVYVTVAIMIFVVLLIVSPPRKHTFRVSSLVFVALIYLLAAFNSLCLSIGYRFTIVQRLSCLYDYMVGLSLLGIVSLCSLMVVPAWLQMRLLFHNAFSQGVLIDDLLKGTISRQKQNANQVEMRAQTANTRGRSPAGIKSMSYQRAHAIKEQHKPPRHGPGKAKPTGSNVVDLPVDTSLVSKTQ